MGVGCSPLTYLPNCFTVGSCSENKHRFYFVGTSDKETEEVSRLVTFRSTFTSAYGQSRVDLGFFPERSQSNPSFGQVPGESFKVFVSETSYSTVVDHSVTEFPVNPFLSGFFNSSCGRDCSNGPGLVYNGRREGFFFFHTSKYWVVLRRCFGDGCLVGDPFLVLDCRETEGSSSSCLPDRSNTVSEPLSNFV